MSLLPSSVCCWWSPRQSDSWDTFPCRLHSAGAFTYRTGPCQVRRVSTVEGAQPAVRDVVAWCRVQPHAITWRSTIRDTVPATAPAFPAAHPTAQLLPRTLSGFLPSALLPSRGRKTHSQHLCFRPTWNSDSRAIIRSRPLPAWDTTPAKLQGQ